VVLGEAAKLVEDLGFDLVDLNLGCPAKQVVKCKAGPAFWRFALDWESQIQIH